MPRDRRLGVVVGGDHDRGLAAGQHADDVLEAAGNRLDGAVGQRALQVLGELARGRRARRARSLLDLQLDQLEGPLGVEPLGTRLILSGSSSPHPARRVVKPRRDQRRGDQTRSAERRA